VSLYFQVEAAALRRRGVYWREIQRRYAGLKLKECVREVEQQSAGGRYAAAEACVVVTGHALPSTAVWLIRAWLLSGDGGWVERRNLVPGYLQGDDASGTLKEAGDASISADESERLRRLIDEAAADRTRHVPSTVFDGDPAEVAVWVRGRGVVLSGDFNLAGVPAAKEELPVVRLIRGVRDLGSKVPLTPLAVGACNALTGQIQLGTT